MIGTFSKEDMADNAVVIYHGHCNDGFGAAWAFGQLAPYSVAFTSYIEGHYGNAHVCPVNDPAKADLWILDFSFPLSTLQALAEEYNQVVVIDHHKTFIDSISTWTHPDIPPNLHVVYDLERSGAGLTWDYLAQLFTPSAFKRPKLINYIEDRDLWKHELQDTKEINAVVAVTPKFHHAYSDLSLDLQQSFGHVAESGKLLLLQFNNIVNDLVKTARPMKIWDLNGEEHNGLVVNCPGHFASDVGNILAVQSGSFGATYHSGVGGDTKFSLRSNGDYDVTVICRTYGGGGHRNAAGFTLKGNPDPDLNGVSVWKTPSDQTILEA